MLLLALTGLLVLAILAAYATCVIVPSREAYILERFGKFKEVLKPGLHFRIPVIEEVSYKQEMREQVLDIPPQMCITRDNIQVEVDGIVYLKIFNPFKASYGIQDYRRACVNLAQTTMRAEIGKLTLDRTFSEREQVNQNIVTEIDKASDPWGVKVLRYEIRNITPSSRVVDTLEKQMEAERQKRAHILLAEAEKEVLINRSQADRQEAVNISEGAREQRINEANGRAREMTLVAEATAEGVKRVGQALGRPGGSMAFKMRLVEQFVDELGLILQHAKVSVVPSDLANIKGFFEGMSQVSSGLSDQSAARPPQPVRSQVSANAVTPLQTPMVQAANRRPPPRNS